MKVTYPLIKRIHGLLPEHIKNDPEEKGDLIQQYTGDPTKRSTKDLEIGQAKTLISDLQKNDPDDRQRKKFLSLCHEMHWHVPGTVSLDWERIDNWLLKYGHKKTRNLNAYHGKELTKLVTQFERVAESYHKNQLKSK